MGKKVDSLPPGENLELIEPKAVVIQSDFQGVTITSRAMSIVMELAMARDLSELHICQRAADSLRKEIKGLKIGWAIERKAEVQKR